MLRSRGPKQDAFSLLLDSWIVAIRGVIKPPECNELAKLLQTLRANMPQILELSQARYGTPPSADIQGLVDWLVEGDFAKAQAVVQSLLTGGRNRASVINA
ncbi:MAG: hypothetical protein ACYC0X_01515 [Pirellulaceae bacterium]